MTLEVVTLLVTIVVFFVCMAASKKLWPFLIVTFGLAGAYYVSQFVNEIAFLADLGFVVSTTGPGAAAALLIALEKRPLQIVRLRFARLLPACLFYASVVMYCLLVLRATMHHTYGWGLVLNSVGMVIMLANYFCLGTVARQCIARELAAEMSKGKK